MKHEVQTRTTKSVISELKKGPRKVQKTTMKNESKSTDIPLSLSDTLDAFPFYVMLIDEHHHILQANRAVHSKLGMYPKDIIGKYCPSAIHGLDHPIDGCPLEKAVETNQAVELEIFDTASGRWVRSSIYPTRGLTSDGRKVFLHMVTDITVRKQAEAEVTASHERLRDLTRHWESVREEERTNLAREIHDELGQILTGLKIDVALMARRLPQTEISFVERVKTINELIDGAVETVKRVSSELRPGALDHLGLAAAIEWQAQELGKRTNIIFEFKPSAKEIVLDRDRSTTIFRICQEALTNVIRHANASIVKITLKKEPVRIVLRISDNGKGIKEEQLSAPQSFGIIGMRERASFWGGTVKIEGSSGKGTVVMVSIPLINRGNLDA